MTPTEVPQFTYIATRASATIQDMGITEMTRIFRGMGKYLLVVLLFASSFSIIGCVESTFMLDGDSRLPRWFTLPPGLARRDVSVTLNYYTWGPAKFILKDWKGKKVAEIKAKEECQLLAGNRGYVFVAVAGRTEVIEHKGLDDLFYLNDDPAVMKQLLASCPKLKQPRAGGPGVSSGCARSSRSLR